MHMHLENAMPAATGFVRQRHRPKDKLRGGPCPERPSNTAFTRIASNASDCKQRLTGAANCTTPPYKSGGTDTKQREQNSITIPKHINSAKSKQSDPM